MTRMHPQHLPTYKATPRQPSSNTNAFSSATTLKDCLLTSTERRSRFWSSLPRDQLRQSRSPNSHASNEMHQVKAGSTQYELRDYVGFLATFGVISASGSEHDRRYRISQGGAEFLSYIKANYPLVWNSRAF